MTRFRHFVETVSYELAKRVPEHCGTLKFQRLSHASSSVWTRMKRRSREEEIMYTRGWGYSTERFTFEYAINTNNYEEHWRRTTTLVELFNGQFVNEVNNHRRHVSWMIFCHRRSKRMTMESVAAIMLLLCGAWNGKYIERINILPIRD